MVETKPADLGLAHPDALIEALTSGVKERLAPFFAQQPALSLLSLTMAEGLIRTLVPAMVAALFESWKEQLMATCKRVGLTCPKCGRRRKCKERQAMKIDVLGFVLWLPRLYLECGHCRGSAVSIMRLLTGLSSGSRSVALQLRAAYCAAKESYRKASDSLKVHYQQHVERTTVRKLALQIEKQATAYVERQRANALDIAAHETIRRGHPQEELTADGGKVRTGKLVPCRPGDRGFGQKSPKRHAPKKTWEVTWREIITFDVRLPGAIDPAALDVLVPILAQTGERARRMLALAIRAGLGHNTEVLGLGDMGSGLAQEFGEAFIGYTASWCADWTHTCDYVKKVGSVLQQLAAADWTAAMRQALWKKDRHRVNKLLAQAHAHRVKALPAQFAKCPIAALQTYVNNNWSYFRFADRFERSLAFVSARAESQVRDRTKDRFSGAGVWNIENLEPKATLRSIIAEGRWEDFVKDQLLTAQTGFSLKLTQRLAQAVASGILAPQQIRDVLGISVETTMQPINQCSQQAA